MAKRVLLIGPYPPPFGGVSIHLERFLTRISQDGRFGADLLDLKRVRVYGDSAGGFISAIRVFLKADIVHIHLSSNIKLLIAFVSKLFGKKVIYTHHNSRINNSTYFAWLVRAVDSLVLVNDRDLKINEGLRDKCPVSTIPAFLPPNKIDGLPEDVKEFVLRSNFVVSTNCSAKAEYQGKDLYGLDVAIEAFSLMLKKGGHSDALLVIVDPSGDNRLFIKGCLDKWEINDRNILYVDRNIDFYSLIKMSSVVLRPTRSDGDSITVREALHEGTIVLASDAAWRPDGVIVYPVESGERLSDLLRNASDGLVDGVVAQADYFEELVEIYSKILEI